MAEYFTAAGKGVRLGKPVGSGGEATVYQVQGQPARLAKIYSAAPRPGYEAKLAWMAAHPPENDPGAPGHRALAWPLELVYDGKPGRNTARAVAGYLMPYVRGAAPLLEVFNPRLRERILPGFDRRYLHRAARNLASALAALHAHHYVVGDLNESNILVTPSALVTLIDVDSFQVIETLPNGQQRVHPCPVGKLEYTAPELQGRALSETRRAREHDAFGLGVLIFQLLMEGNHPFRARWLAPGDPPPLEQRLAKGWFPYVANPEAPLRPPQGAPALETLSPRLGELVRRCFADARADPTLRPSALEWAGALAEAERSLLPCPNGHWFSSHLPACPTCGALNPLRAGSPRPEPARRPTAAAANAPPARDAAARPPAERRPNAEPVSPPPGTRNPRPAAAAEARQTRPKQPSGVGGQQAAGGPNASAQHSQTRNPQPPNASTPTNPSDELQRRAWAFARRQAVTMLRRRYPWIPAAWAGAPATATGGAKPPTGGPASSAGAPSASSAGTAHASSAGTAHASHAGAAAPPHATPAGTANPAPQTPPSSSAGTANPAHQTPPPASTGPMPRAPYGPPASPVYAAPRPQNYLTSRFALRALGLSVWLGAGRGLLVGALPGLLAAVAAGLLEVGGSWAVLAALGGAAGAAASAWLPGVRLANIIERRVGWRPLLGGLGALLGAGLGAIASLPIFFLVIPVILGLFFGGRIGLGFGRRVYELGVNYGWERIGRWGGLAAAGVWGAWLGGKLAGSALGLQIGAWSAAQAAAFSAWAGTPAAAWALAGALAGGLGGALCGFLLDVPARLTRLAE